MKKSNMFLIVYCLVSLVLCISSIPVTAEDSGTITLRFSDQGIINQTERDAQYGCSAMQTETTTKFTSMNIKVAKVEEYAESTCWESNVSSLENISIALKPGTYKVYTRLEGDNTVLEYNNNSEGYVITPESQLVVPMVYEPIKEDYILDVPWRIEKSELYIPILAVVTGVDGADINNIYVYDHNDGDREVASTNWASPQPIYLKTPFFYLFNLDKNLFVPVYGEISIKIKFDFDWWPLPDYLEGPINVRIAPDDIPKMPDWYCGDTHQHTKYTHNIYEFGAPIYATKAANNAMGLDWMIVTDHSFDLDPDEWDIQTADCNANSDENFRVLQGEEVSCYVPGTGIYIPLIYHPLLGEVCFHQYYHILAYGMDFIPGGEWGDRWTSLDGPPDGYTPEEMINLVNSQGGVVYAAHPTDGGWHWEEALSIPEWDPFRDPWRDGDYELNLHGIQIWNHGSKRCIAKLESGIEKWKELLLDGGHIYVEGGTDAHGDFNTLAGKVKTYVYVPGYHQSSLPPRGKIIKALKNGHSIMTDGPLLIFNITNEYGETAIIGNETAGSDLTLNIQWESTSEFEKVDYIYVHLGIIGETEEEISEYRLTPNSLSGTHSYSDLASKIPLSRTAYIRLSATTQLYIDESGYVQKNRVYTNPIWVTPVIINIISPTYASQSSAGAFDNPSHIDVTVEVKEGTTPATGLANADFSFKIGGKTATASLTDTSIPGTYKFDVTPPTQAAAGKYDLEVTVTYSGCSYTDTEQEAVVYSSGNVDVMLIIDRSGSMLDEIGDARNAAKLFIDYMRDDDKAGIVSFSSSASYNYHLTTLTSSVKMAIKSAINGISASGSTTMGKGLRYGLNDLTSRGDSTHPWAMVLLSDGYHNSGEHPNNVLPAIRNANIKVFTIGLGSYVDTNLLRSIAANSGAGGGKYYHAPSSSDLQEIYDLIVGMVTGQQTSYSTSGTILPGQTSSLTVPITSSTTSATFSISWGGSNLDLVLYKPDGTEINPDVAATDPNIDYVEESTYEFYRMDNPDVGEWTMEITAISVPTEGEDYTAKVRVVSTLTISLMTDKDQYNQGEVVKTTVSLTGDGSPLTGATVTAKITLPDSSTETFTLYDDGGHGDTAANDGVYANYFVNTLQTGDYTVDVSATGTTSTGEQFSREGQCTFKVVAGPSLITLTPDRWIEATKAGEHIQGTFTVIDPAKIGELFPLDESTYAEYNGTHYLVYNESSIGGEPDNIIPALPSSESLADGSTVGSAQISISPSASTKQLSSNPASKWVALTPTSLQAPSGDIIDVSNTLISPNILDVPLEGSKDFNVSINIPLDAKDGTYSGLIIATSITGSDSIDVRMTVISNPIGGFSVAILPKLNSANAGASCDSTVRLRNTQNFDEYVDLDLTLSGIPAEYAADLAWFNWTTSTLSIPAGEYRDIGLRMDIPDGISGYKSYGIIAHGTFGDSKDYGVVDVT